MEKAKFAKGIARAHSVGLAFEGVLDRGGSGSGCQFAAGL